MKKAIVLIVLLAGFCLMGGCLEETPLTDGELDVVAEYAAGLLLKYDANYETFYLPMEQESPTVTPDATPTAEITNPGTAVPTSGAQPSEIPNATPTPIQSATTPTLVPATPTPTLVPENSEFTNEQLSRVIDVDNLMVRYDSYNIYKSYNSNTYYSLEAKDGRQYLIVAFQLENTSQADQKLCLSDEKFLYSLYLNVNTMIRPTFTMEVNDIHFLGTKDSPFILKAGEVFDSILVFDIPDDEDIDSAHLTIMNTENKETVFIKLK